MLCASLVRSAGARVARAGAPILATTVVASSSAWCAANADAAPRRAMSGDAASSGGSKLWGGRFTGKTDPHMEKFNASIGFDQRMADADVTGSQAYARALQSAGLITEAEAKSLVDGLETVRGEWADGSFEVVDATDEDIHTANERRLGELVGSVAGKLHTGRSRNDQVATDVRLWLSAATKGLQNDMLRLITVIADRAEAEIDVLMPGYTHLQPAQPIRWAHWLMSHAAALQRDAERLAQLRGRVEVLPLGSGAIAGHPFGIDRHQIAKELGFPKITPNSLDAVSDRDFILEFLFWASLTGVHLSRVAEDLIIYSTAEFGFVKLSDAYSTGSSLMPQKKNPDAMELVRGKSGRPIGSLMTLFTVVKGLPSTYNKDLQEDKEPLFDAVDTMRGVLPICEGVISTLTINEDRMLASLDAAMLATDLADYLVRKGVPFRETHHVAGRAVQLAEDTGVKLTDLTPEQLRTLHTAFEDDVTDVWDFTRSVESRNSPGGTSKSAVQQQIVDMRAWVETQRV